MELAEKCTNQQDAVQLMGRNDREHDIRAQKNGPDCPFEVSNDFDWILQY
jgi:hypothetical protein